MGLALFKPHRLRRWYSSGKMRSKPGNQGVSRGGRRPRWSLSGLAGRAGFGLLALCLCLWGAGCDRGWSFAVFGDPALGGPEKTAPPVFSRIVESVNRSGAELVFVTGDLVYGRNLYRAETAAQYRRARDLLSGLRRPVHAVPGNHDLEGPAGFEEYESLFGSVPWVFRHRGWTFIGLSTEGTGTDGCVAGEQLQWLRARLGEQGGRGRVAVFLHRPVWPVPVREQGYHSLPQPELHRALAEARVKAVFAGHEHRFRQEVRDGVLYVVTGGAGPDLAADGCFHFVLVEVRGDAVSPRMVRLEEAGEAEVH
jgi:predicted phosphodiesterase